MRTKHALSQKEKIAQLQKAYNEGKLRFSARLTKAIAQTKAIKEFAAAFHLAKTTSIGKAFIRDQGNRGISLKGSTLHLSPHFMIVRTSGSNQFYRLTGEYRHALYLVPTHTPPPFLVTHNLRSTSLSEIVAEMAQLEALRPGRQIDVSHHIISFAPASTPFLDDDKLKDIAQKFIDLRGPNCAWFANVHYDTGHRHIHLAQSSTTLDAKSSRISKQEFIAIKNELQRFQIERYPELSDSIVQHGRKGKEKRQNQKIDRPERFSVRGQVSKLLDTAFQKNTSTEELYQHLKDHGAVPYERSRNQITGVMYEGKRFRFSTLGYSDKLAELEKRDQQFARELKTLHDLRQGKQQGRNLSEPTKETTVPDTNIESELDEIQSIRDGSQGSEVEQELSDESAQSPEEDSLDTDKEVTPEHSEDEPEFER